VAFLPPHWRVVAAIIFAVLAVVSCSVLWVLNVVRGGRQVGWMAAAVGSAVCAPIVAFVIPEQIAGLDVRAATLAASLFTTVLLVRHSMMVRDRHGRDVLGRAAIGDFRDPLTALWAYDGFQQRHAEAALREAAGQGTSSVMLIALPGLDNAGVQHGTTMTELTLVRFAAAMQRLLGQRWAVARVSRTRFAAISLRPLNPVELADTATQVLAQCARITQPLNLVNDFDLRIACSRRRIAETPMPELLRELKQAALALDFRKRIAYLQPMPAAAVGEVAATELAPRP
jgi:GGDEF domain-containing protein